MTGSSWVVTVWVLVLMALDLALWLAVIANGVGCPVGPRREFGASLAERPGRLPPPPDPAHNVWQPWLRFWGPAWINLKFAVTPPRGLWRGYLHEQAAYRFYLRDDLGRAVRAAQDAIGCGVRPRQWAAQLHYLASAELAAREGATQAQHGTLTFESAFGDPAPEALLRVVDAVVESTRAAIGFEAPELTISVLDDEGLPRGVGSRYAYLARRLTGDRVCLLAEPTAHPDAAAEGFACEYVRLALGELAGERAPEWLLEGLTRWVAQRAHAPLPPPEAPAEAARHPTAGERALEAALGRSLIDCAVRRGLSAAGVVGRLIRRYGPDAMRRFAEGLQTRNESAAFERAFVVSQSEYLRER